MGRCGEWIFFGHHQRYGNWRRHNLIPALLFSDRIVNQQQAQGVNLIYFIPNGSWRSLRTVKRNNDLQTAKAAATSGSGRGGGRGISGGFAGIGDTEKKLFGELAADGAQ